MKHPCRGFTLFELILAVALSATLLALIGTAINLYLIRVDASRTHVEEAQLARSILAMIADDIRSTTIHQPQDTSAIAQLMANRRASDDASDDGDDGGNRTEGTGTLGGTGTPGGTTSIASSSSSFGGGNMSTGSSSTSADADEADGTLPLGLNGTLTELYVDVTRLPRRDELFATITGYTNAPMPMPAAGTGTSMSAAAAAGVVPPSDLKTVWYFLRQGDQIESASVATSSLAPELQQHVGGLVRQGIPRTVRKFAEENGNSALWNARQTLVAPEVVHLEFRYYDGQQVTEVWDMREEDSLPLAIEVRIWLASPQVAASEQPARYDPATLIQTAREYRRTVYLPMSAIFSSGNGGSTTGSSPSSTSSSGSSSSFGSATSGSGPP